MLLHCLLLHAGRMSTKSYQWALRAFFSLLEPTNEPPILCTDKDPALLSTIRESGPRCRRVAPIRMYKQIARKNFATSQEYDIFFSHWTKFATASIHELYEKARDQMKPFLANKQHVLRYLDETWLYPSREICCRKATEATRRPTFIH